MKRILSKFGAYSSHLIALSEDSSVKSVDLTKLRGYSLKWSNAKTHLCFFVTFFHHVLYLAKFFSKIHWISWKHLPVFFALCKNWPRLVQSLYSNGLIIHPLWKTSLKKVVVITFYQQQNLPIAKCYYQAHFDEYCTSVTTCLRSWMSQDWNGQI